MAGEQEQSHLIQSDDPGVEIRMIARLKHGGIMRAADKLGSLKALAKYLEVGYSTLCHWGTLRCCPPSCPRAGWTQQRLDTLDGRFRELIGQGIAELFPDSLRNARDWRKQSKKFERTAIVSPEKLQELSERTEAYYLDDSFGEVETAELREHLNRLIQELPQRVRQVIQLRWGMYDDNPYTLREVGHILKVSAERVRQMESKGLRILQSKIQRPENSHLLDFVRDPEDPGWAATQLSPLSQSSGE